MEVNPQMFVDIRVYLYISLDFLRYLHVSMPATPSIVGQCARPWNLPGMSAFSALPAVQSLRPWHIIDVEEEEDEDEDDELFLV